MSQDKVNRYKEEKGKRKQAIAKEKQKKLLRKVTGIIVGVALIGWIGYSAVDLYQDSRPREMVEIDYTAMNEYLQTIAE